MREFLFLGYERLLDNLLARDKKAYRFYTLLNDGKLVDATVKLVSLDSLYCTQSRVDEEAIEEYLSNPRKISIDRQHCVADLPLVMNYTSKHFVLDGHHRFASKKLRGMHRAKTYYWDLDWYLRSN